MKTTKIDLAYAAGIIDGEGCIQISRHAERKHHLNVYVLNLPPEIPEFMHKHFGGSLWKQRQYFRWTLCNKSAVEFLCMVKPYLVLKPRQAEVGIKFGELLKPRGGSPKGRNGRAPLTDEEIQERDELYFALRRLHKCA